MTQGPPNIPPQIDPSASPLPQEEKRPVGLAIMAIVNFILVGLIAVFIWFMHQMTDRAASVGYLPSPSTQSQPAGPVYNPAEAYNARFNAEKDRLILIAGIEAFLLVISAIGYLKRSRRMGYVFGMLYGLAGILGAIVLLSAGQSRGLILAVAGLTYGILTIILLNTAFRKCWR